METVNDVLRLYAEKYPDREAFIFFDRRGRHSVCTPKELYHLAGKFAFQLRGQGFQDGEVICNGVPNSVERLVTDYGIILAGCVPVNCQVVEKDGADFWNMALLSNCVAVIIPARDKEPSYNLFKEFLPEVIPDTGQVEVSIPKAPKLRKIILVDRYSSTGGSQSKESHVPSLLTHLREIKGDIFNHQSEPLDLAYIHQTSGSTGYSKLIPRTHEEILLMARALARTSPDESKETSFNDRPFGWAGGFPLRYFGACAPTVAQDCFDDQQAQNVKQLWNGIVREKCTGAFILPGDVLRLVEEFKADPPEFQLDVIISSGQPITKVSCHTKKVKDE